MSKKNDSGYAAKIVKVDGSFTEWYAPGYKNPYDDTAGFAGVMDIAGLPYVYGPEVSGECEFLCDDLQSLCEREVVDVSDDWGKATTNLMEAAETALVTGAVQKVKIGNAEFTCTPYAEVPAIPDSAYEVFREFAGLVRERVAAI